MESNVFDVIITGGGIMGSATAYYLMKSDPTLKLAVVERDPTYARASTTLSMSNVRIQFSLKQYIQTAAQDLLSPGGQPLSGRNRKPGSRQKGLRPATQLGLPHRVVVADANQGALPPV